MALVLVVEDELDLNNLIRDNLLASGHAIEQAFTGRQAVEAVGRELPDLVVLDWMLPDMDGLTVCRRLRERHLMPIIMLTARGEEIDRVQGLEVGADDYITKPFSMRELMARVVAVLRRVEMDARSNAATDTSGPDRVVTGDLIVDPGARVATLAGEPVQLTPKEFDVLYLLVSNPGRAFSRDFLIERLWPDEYEGLERAVDTHVTRLRRKLGKVGDQIVTVWGFGYRFVRQC